MSAECLDIIGNDEILALNQDPRVSRAKLVYQWPMAKWPNADSLPGSRLLPDETWAPQDVSVNITLQAWAKTLADGSVAVVAFNRGDKAVSMNVTWSMIGLADTEVASVRDLWAHAEMGKHSGAYVCESIPARDVCSLKITPADIA